MKNMLLLLNDFDENLVVISLSTLVSFERRIVSDLRLTSSSSFCQIVHFVCQIVLWIIQTWLGFNCQGKLQSQHVKYC